MHLFMAIIIATPFAVVAAPDSLPRSGIATSTTSNPSTSGAFSVRQVRNPNFVRTGRGPVELAKTYHKYGVPLPHDLKAAVTRILGKRSTGSEVATPQTADSEYLTPVSIGTPSQVLNLNFDTGSSDLWVFSTGTPLSQVNGQTLYDPSQSSTASKLEGYTWVISYGDGSGSGGDVYNDTVTIGGLTASSQAVQCATYVSSEFTADGSLDGLLGLGFGSINTVLPLPQNTFFQNVKHVLDKPVFTADLRAGVPGRYNFGYIDPSAHTGNITYVPVDSSEGYWEWTSSGYAVGSAAFNRTAIKAIADTGTSLLLLPSSVASAYYAKASGAGYDSSQGGWVLPCSGTPPDFTFGVGDDGATITVPGRYIQYAPTDSSERTCFGGIQDDAEIQLTIFGDVALKAAFVVFDGDHRLGWAPKPLS